MSDAPTRHREYERIHNFHPLSLADRLSAILEQQQQQAQQQQHEHVPLNSDDHHLENSQDQDELNPVGLQRIQERIDAYEGEEGTYGRVAIAIMAVLLITSGILLPEVLLKSPSWCGNGVVDILESCDDGNADD